MTREPNECVYCGCRIFRKSHSSDGENWAWVCAKCGAIYS